MASRILAPTAQTMTPVTSPSSSVRVEYNLYELKGDGQTCPGLSPGNRRFLCWNNMFLLPGFERAEFSPALRDVAQMESHEFVELKRQVCDATLRYRVASWPISVSSFLIIGIMITLQVLVLSNWFGVILALMAVLLSFVNFFTHYSRVTTNNRVVDEEVDRILSDFNMRKRCSIASLKRSNVEVCKHGHQRCERKIVFGLQA